MNQIHWYRGENHFFIMKQYDTYFVVYIFLLIKSMKALFSTPPSRSFIFFLS